MRSTNKNAFLEGLRDGMPIGLGYLSVSFSFGIMAVSKGLSVLAALLISMTNLTSAGQVAGLAIITAGGTLTELALAQCIINLRYALMSLSLSQKLATGFSSPHRFLTAFGITDEIFAVASGRKHAVTPAYLYGLIAIPFVSWSLGTFLGGLAGELLPLRVKAALGIAIYGMFIAIFVPPARKSAGVLTVVLTAVALSCCIYYIPALQGISSGFSIILCTIAAAVAGAIFFPVPVTEVEEETS